MRLQPGTGNGNHQTAEGCCKHWKQGRAANAPAPGPAAAAVARTRGTSRWTQVSGAHRPPRGAVQGEAMALSSLPHESESERKNFRFQRYTDKETHGKPPRYGGRHGRRGLRPTTATRPARAAGAQPGTPEAELELGHHS